MRRLVGASIDARALGMPFDGTLVIDDGTAHRIVSMALASMVPCGCGHPGCPACNPPPDLEREVQRLRGEKPKPWRIDSDWTVEVLAADGTCVAKFQTREEAEDFIAAHMGEGNDGE